MKAYYGNRFSPNMTKTPEGFIVCHNVPIARIGWQEYLPREIGESGSGLIRVCRNEEEVFSKATIASFEGKIVTDDHPPVSIDNCNYNAYMKGIAQNVHRGAGDTSDFLLADLVIYDSVLISEIEAGKREVSCGYECQYEPCDDGTYKQTNIVGNHVAVVKNGRAGHKVAIKDEKPKEKKRMKKGNIFDRMFSVFCKDADPEEIKEAADAISCVQDEDPDKKEEPMKKETTDTVTRLMQMDARIANIEKMLTKDEDTKEEKNTLDELEAELEKKETADSDEESVTVAPDKVQDNQVGEKAKDSTPILNIVRAIKPILAELPNEQRKNMSDKLSEAVRNAMQIKANQQTSYASMLNRKTADAEVKEQNKAAFGESCRKRNPHYKEEK